MCTNFTSHGGKKKKVLEIHPTAIATGVNDISLKGIKKLKFIKYITSGISILTLTIKVWQIQLFLRDQKERERERNLSCIICKILMTLPKRRLLPCGVEPIHHLQKYHSKSYKNILQQALFITWELICKNRYWIKISHKQWIELLRIMILKKKKRRNNFHNLLSFPKERNPTSVNDSYIYRDRKGEQIP